MVHVSDFVIALAATALTVQAAPIEIEKRADGCSSYIIIDTRGTGELQGPSAGFRTMNSKIQTQKPGGSVYNTRYPADFTQISTVGTNDIVSKVEKTLASSPGTCFVLEGYSQGAAATTNALPKLTGSAFDAVKAVFLIGNPEHRKGKACNVDMKGGKSTANVNGLSAVLGGIPDNWISKTLDVCNFGDGVCDTTHGLGINAQHLAYPMSSSTQSMGAEFVVKMLNADSASVSGATKINPSTTASSTDTSNNSGSDSSSSGVLGGSGGLSGLGGSKTPFSGLLGGKS